MPRLSCECGTVINLSKVPSPYGAVAISESAWDAMSDRLREAITEGGDWQAVRHDVLGFRNRAIKKLYLCPNCGRLYLFDSPSDDNPAAVWTLERGEPQRLLS